MKFNKIVIVGGGSAGWMTAATLIKAYPKNDITLIESPNAPILGVGESTLGQINNWLDFLGIKDEEFIKAKGFKIFTKKILEDFITLLVNLI